MLRLLLGIAAGVVLSLLVWTVSDGGLPIVDDVAGWVEKRVENKPIYCRSYPDDPEGARVALEKLYEDRRNGIDPDAVCRE